MNWIWRQIGRAVLLAGALPGLASAQANGETQASQGVSGLYVGFRPEPSRPGQLYRKFFYFYPEGWFLPLEPTAGVPSPNLEAALAKIRRDPQWRNFYGRYSRDEGNRLLLHYNGGDEGVVTIQDKGSELGLEKYVPLCQCDQLRLDGTFAMGDGQTITFLANGQFVDRGALPVLLGNRTAGPGAGIYGIAGNRVMFQYPDGRRFGAFFAALARLASSPPWILMGASKLGRVTQ